MEETKKFFGAKLVRPCIINQKSEIHMPSMTSRARAYGFPIFDTTYPSHFMKDQIFQLFLRNGTNYRKSYYIIVYPCNIVAFLFYIILHILWVRGSFLGKGTFPNFRHGGQYIYLSAAALRLSSNTDLNSMDRSR